MGPGFQSGPLDFVSGGKITPKNAKNSEFLSNFFLIRFRIVTKRHRAVARPFFFRGAGYPQLGAMAKTIENFSCL
jgi:hypothetical protein